MEALGKRIRELYETLNEIWEDPTTSTFYEMFMEWVKALKTRRKAVSVLGDENYIGTA